MMCDAGSTGQLCDCHERLLASHELLTALLAEAYSEGRWCGECRYGLVEDPPCCTGVA